MFTEVRLQKMLLQYENVRNNFTSTENLDIGTVHSIITRFNNLGVVEEGIKKTAWSVLSYAFRAGLVKHISILKQKY